MKIKFTCKLWLKNGNVITETIKTPVQKSRQVVQLLENAREKVGTECVFTCGHITVNMSEVVAIKYS